MRLRACSTLLLLLLACVTTEPRLKGQVVQSQRISNLQRAVALPWKDEGRCVVQEASQTWPVVVDRCFHALDMHRIRFRDTERRCPVALVDESSVETMVGICLLTQPEVVVGAVVIIGVVVVAVAIKEELDAAELPEQAVAEEKPAPKGLPSIASGSPPRPPVLLMAAEGRPECTPFKIPPRGGNAFHNMCADNVPSNAYRGHNVTVNGKAYDAMDPITGTLWEVKTNAIETYNDFVQRAELTKQVEEGRRERDLAAACGYKFVIGVRTQLHQEMLNALEPDLTVVLMPWC